MPKGITWYLYLAHCGAVLGSWTRWGTRKWNRQRAHKGHVYSEFEGPEPFLGVSKQNIKNKMLHDPCNTQRQARKLILGPSPATNTRLLSFNRAQSRVVTGLTGHITLRRHLHLMGLSNNPTCRNVAQRRKPQSTFCVSVRPWLYSDIHIWVPSFWTLRILRVLSLGAIWNFCKRTGLPWPSIIMGHKGPVLRHRCIGT